MHRPDRARPRLAVWLDRPRSRCADFALHIHQRSAAFGADVPPPCHPPPIHPPRAASTSETVRCRLPRRRRHLTLGVTPSRRGADAPARRLPPASMPVAGRQRVCDLVQDGVLHLLDPVQDHQRPRQRDQLRVPLARSKPAPRMIKPERPAAQAMFLHQSYRQVACFGRMHTDQYVNNPRRGRQNPTLRCFDARDIFPGLFWLSADRLGIVNPST